MAQPPRSPVQPLLADLSYRGIRHGYRKTNPPQHRQVYQVITDIADLAVLYLMPPNYLFVGIQLKLGTLMHVAYTEFFRPVLNGTRVPAAYNSGLKPHTVPVGYPRTVWGL